MKVYIQHQRVTVVGKGWQVRAIIKQYMKRYETVEEWIKKQDIKR
ncbi:Z-ring formation inhibitor MciZ [Anaerobacillus sp. MEB173]